MTKKADDQQVLMTKDLWPDPNTGPFFVNLYWTLLDSRWQVVGLEIRACPRPTRWGGAPFNSPREANWRADNLSPMKPPRALTSIRTFPLGAIARHAAFSEAVMLGLGRTFEGRQAELSEAAAAWEAAASEQSRRQSLGVQHYLEVQDVYERALPFGAPLVAVMRHFNAKPEWAERPVTKGQAAQWVYRCRHGFPKPLLPPARKEGTA